MLWRDLKYLSLHVKLLPLDCNLLQVLMMQKILILMELAIWSMQSNLNSAHVLVLEVFIAYLHWSHKEGLPFTLNIQRMQGGSLLYADALPDRRWLGLTLPLLAASQKKRKKKKKTESSEAYISTL
ncbi:hypothetical protein NL676_026606 [Syzygium grande]|nr:hypothetical protein NL676_026606 [Syzygium grande]